MAGPVNGKATTLLMTCELLVDVQRRRQKARAFIDMGSSISFITCRLANSLQAKKIPRTTNIVGIQGQKVSSSQCMVDLNLIPSTGRWSPLQIRATVVEKVTADSPVQEVPNIKSLPLLQGLVLADPNLDKPSRIDMLISMDYFNDVVIPGVITPSASQLRIYQTIFGWVIAGQCNTSATEEVAHVSLCTSIVDTPSTDILRSFWVVEGINSPKHAITAEEQQAVDFFQKTFSRDGEGRYHVSLTKKIYPPALENSRDRAVKRYLHSE